MNSDIEQYLLVRKLGEGGMGTVYLAEDKMLERQVAIKQVNKSAATDEHSGNRFQQEALALARLNHPNITHLYSFLTLDDAYWMVMEYVEGKTLEDWISHHGKITAFLAASIAVQLLEGLIHAHRKGIIHRDLKPANVMINEDGEIKIMDFGIARIRNSQRMTRHGKSVGTLEYMAPEQIQGAEGDERTDVYAVGNILYELLCGQTPFQGDTDYHIMKAKLEEAPQDITVFNSSVPLALQKVIAKALERKPEKRYESAAALQLAILQSVNHKLLNNAELVKALHEVQKFEVTKAQATGTVNQLLSQAKKISGRFNTVQVKKMDKPILLLVASVVICAGLLLWNFLSSPARPEEPQEAGYKVTDTVIAGLDTSEAVQDDETPNELYDRITKQPTVEPATGSEKKQKVEVRKSNTDTEKPKNETAEAQDKKKEDIIETPVVKEEVTAEKADPVVVFHAPVNVPAGRMIQVMLDETLSSEEKSRDGSQVRLHCLEDVEAGGRVIFRKGAVVTGKIVDVVPSTGKKKALIGFVIIKIEATDGSPIKLSSDRFRLFAQSSGEAVYYKQGQTFQAELGRGVVR